MALGTVIMGSEHIINAATTTGPVGGIYTAGTFSPVSDMNRVDYNANRPVTNIAVFGRAVQYSIPGVKEQTLTISGFKSVGDTGQGILDTAETTDAVIAIQVLRDGTNGWQLFGRVGSIRESAAPEGLQEISYDINAITEREDVP
jgi:hypothetical protein